MSSQALTADYASSNSRRTFSESLPSLSTPAQAQSVPEKTAYLSALRSGATQMQADINAFLTNKMEEDKAGEASKTWGKQKTQEEKAEEMYGEEDPEEDG